MQSVERWPVNIETLNKGDTISADRLEEITGVSRDSRSYPLKVQTVKERIERELAMRGRVCTLACVGPDLRVLTDPEATVYNDREFRRSERAMYRRHMLQLAVDAANLDEGQREDHERRVLVQSRKVQALQKVRRKLETDAVKRTVPGSLSKSGTEPDVTDVA